MLSSEGAVDRQPGRLVFSWVWHAVRKFFACLVSSVMFEGDRVVQDGAVGFFSQRGRG